MSHFHYLTEEQILNSPSFRDGISTADEENLRKSSCSFIRSLCKQLDLYPCRGLSHRCLLTPSQKPMSPTPHASSSIAFTVFSRIKPTIGLYDLRWTCHEGDRGGLLFSRSQGGGKLSESGGNCKELLCREEHPGSRCSASESGFVVFSRFQDIKMKVLLAERVILNVLSFDLIIEQPFNAIFAISTELSSTFSPSFPPSSRKATAIRMALCE